MRKIQFVFLIGILFMLGCKNDSEELAKIPEPTSSQKTTVSKKPVIITITVDTEKLKNAKPGEITDRTIVVMTDNQTDSFYKDSNGGIYKDKLITVASPDDTLFWEIVAANKSDKLVLVQCNPSAALVAMLSEQPHEDSADPKKKWKAKLKNGLAPNLTGFYTYSFAFKTDLTKTWSWDPDIKSKPPIV